MKQVIVFEPLTQRFGFCSFLLPLDPSLQLAGLSCSLPPGKGDTAEMQREKEQILGFEFQKLRVEMTPGAGKKLEEERERLVGGGGAGPGETAWM